MKYIFIINSFTVKDNINFLIHNIKEYCEKKNYKYEIEINNIDNSTESIVSKYKKDKNIIIAIGGDGMINRVLNSIVNTKNILSFIPYGTGNDFYRICLKEFKDKYNDCDLVKINNKYFINVACFGIDAYAANNNKILRNRYIPKNCRYTVSALDAFVKYKPLNAIVKINSETIKGCFSTIVVCNGEYYGGGYNINPKSKLNNDLVDVYLADKMNKVSMAKLMMSMKNAKHLKSNMIHLYHTNKLSITFDREVNSNIDGEELEDNKFNIEVVSLKQKIYFDKDMIKNIIK